MANRHYVARTRSIESRLIGAVDGARRREQQQKSKPAANKGEAQMIATATARALTMPTPAAKRQRPAALPAPTMVAAPAMMEAGQHGMPRSFRCPEELG